MIPPSFREALDALEDAVYSVALADERGGRRDRAAAGKQRAAARAEVERLYAERAGEEYEVLEADVAYGPYKHLGSVTTTIVELNDYTYKPGDRVFVTKGEAG